MAVTTINLIQGPATGRIAPFGATEPVAGATAATVAPAAAWVDFGGTTDGVTVNIEQEWSEMEVDQLVDTPESRLTKRGFTIETNMAEATLANLKIGLNGGTLTAGEFEPADVNSSNRPDYFAIMLDGAGEGGFGRRFIGRKMLSVEGVEFAYEKEDQTVFAVTFRGHYVSPSIRPFRVINATA
jgi:hypothetical protein